MRAPENRATISNYTFMRKVFQVLKKWTLNEIYVKQNICLWPTACASLIPFVCKIRKKEMNISITEVTWEYHHMYAFFFLSWYWCHDVGVLVITSNTLIDLYRDHYIKISSLGWALIQSYWYPCKNGEFGHRGRHVKKEDNVKTHKEKMAMWPEWGVYKTRDTKDFW